MNYYNQAYPLQLSDAEVRALWIQQAQGWVDLEKQRAAQSQRLAFEAQLNDIRSNAKKALIQYQETIRKKRELETEAIRQGDDGFLRLELVQSDGSSMCSPPICSMRYVHGVLLCCTKYPEMFIAQISWEGCTHPIMIALENITPSFLAAEFRKRGIQLRTSRRKRAFILECFLDYIARISETIEIPSSFGWCLLSTGRWHFSKDKDLNFTEVLKYVK